MKIWKMTALVVATLVVIVAGIVSFAELGFVNIRADIQPFEVESTFAMSAVDASVDRHAPKTKNPLEPTEETVHAGAMLYRDNCSGCHGDPANPEATLGGRLRPTLLHFRRGSRSNKSATGRRTLRLHNNPGSSEGASTVRIDHFLANSYLKS